MDIYRYSAFCLLEKSLEEKIEELVLRAREEDDILNTLKDENSVTNS